MGLDIPPIRPSVHTHAHAHAHVHAHVLRARRVTDLLTYWLKLAHLARCHAVQGDRAHGAAAQVEQPQACALAQPTYLVVTPLPQL